MNRRDLEKAIIETRRYLAHLERQYEQCNGVDYPKIKPVIDQLRDQCRAHQWNIGPTEIINKEQTIKLLPHMTARRLKRWVQEGKLTKVGDYHLLFTLSELAECVERYFINWTELDR